MLVIFAICFRFCIVTKALKSMQAFTFLRVLDLGIKCIEAGVSSFGNKQSRRTLEGHTVIPLKSSCPPLEGDKRNFVNNTILVRNVQSSRALLLFFFFLPLCYLHKLKQSAPKSFLLHPFFLAIVKNKTPVVQSSPQLFLKVHF